MNGVIHSLWATCKDPERAKVWLAVRPDGKLPVDGQTRTIEIEGRGQVECYMVEVDRLAPIERALLIKAVAAKFHDSVMEVAADLDRMGMPVPVSDVLVEGE